MPGTISQYQVVIAGQLITASLWNGMELNIINNGLIPAGIDDYSATDGEMQTATDPFPGGTTSRPTSLQGELERIRYQFANITGETYWYNDPDVTIAAMKTNFDAHTHDGTSNNGPQIGVAGLQDGAVTTAKLAEPSVTNIKMAANSVDTTQLVDGSVTTAKLQDTGVTPAKLNTSVAGDGLAGGGGTALSVNVDSSTIEINSDTLRVKDSGITTAKIADTNVTEAKLATAVVNKLGQNIGLVTIVSSSSNGDLVNYSGQGKLKGVCVQPGSNATFSVVVDGVTIWSSASMAGGSGLAWDETGVVESTGAVLNSLEILFKTSLVVNKTAGTGTIKVAYERAA